MDDNHDGPCCEREALWIPWPWCASDISLCIVSCRCRLRRGESRSILSTGANRVGNPRCSSSRSDASSSSLSATLSSPDRLLQRILCSARRDHHHYYYSFHENDACRPLVGFAYPLRNTRLGGRKAEARPFLGIILEPGTAAEMGGLHACTWLHPVLETLPLVIPPALDNKWEFLLPISAPPPKHQDARHQRKDVERHARFLLCLGRWQRQGWEDSWHPSPGLKILCV
ncbi:hypothetical protein VTN02DRAFT_337 [Thermoascus thermophilus]